MQRLVCITRDYIHLGLVPGSKTCDGSRELRDTHCVFCEYYDGSLNNPDDEMIENPIIFESEEGSWEV